MRVPSPPLPSLRREPDSIASLRASLGLRTGERAAVYSGSAVVDLISDSATVEFTS